MHGTTVKVTILYVICQQHIFIYVPFIGMCVSVLTVASSSLEVLYCSLSFFLCVSLLYSLLLLIVQSHTTSYCAVTHYFLLCSHTLLLIVQSHTTSYCAVTHCFLLCSHTLLLIVQSHTTSYCAVTHCFLLCSHTLLLIVQSHTTSFICCRVIFFYRISFL